jgi:ABC-type polar amino acid transport system ATPase subunit
MEEIARHLELTTRDVQSRTPTTTTAAGLEGASALLMSVGWRSRRGFRTTSSLGRTTQRISIARALAAAAWSAVCDRARRQRGCNGPGAGARFIMACSASWV